MAFRLFSTPRRIPLRKGDLAFFAEGKQHKIQVRHHYLMVYEWVPATWSPAGKTVLLLHGWDSSSARWRKLTRTLLKSGYRVLAMDAPGSGQSSGKRLNLGIFSKAVRRVEEAFGLPYARIGHSLGGAASIMSSAFYGAETPQKIVLLGVFAESTRVIHGFAGMMGLEPNIFGLVNEEVLRKTGRTLEEFSVRSRVSEFTHVRGLVIHDVQDSVAPVEEGRQVAQAWNAEYHETDGFGHSLQHKSVNERILHFLEAP